VALAFAARHNVQVVFRYLVPRVGVKSSSDLVRPQHAQLRMPGGACGFDGRGGRAVLARAARHGLHRVCVHGVPFIGV
jgi:hypothetical protein